ncbi:MAG TPA: 4-alpha-glucanotransferase [Herpetosiphonaceae bacterium]
MYDRRASGILLHPTSLPGPGGIGDLGSAAYGFIDWLVSANQRRWQIMPLGPTSYGDSPYASLSALAGNPLLISVERLVEDGLLPRSTLDRAPAFPAAYVDFGAVIPWKSGILQEAYAHFTAGGAPEQRAAFEAFIASHAVWLDDFALFTALKNEHGGASWSEWEMPLRQRDPAVLADARARLAEQIRFQQFAQWLFFTHWLDLKRYANEHGILIIGDIPIFVAYDSADVWANPDLFYLDEQLNPTVVAGVPPDYFSATGQRWGNPLYCWDVLERQGYGWWLERFRLTLTLVDIVRLDHFRGFEAYWEVPAHEETAMHGRWVKGPGTALFKAIGERFGRLPIIAEDLGLITPDVDALRDELGFPGMAVLQFAWGDRPTNVHQPHNYHRNLVVYTGTHDNNTTIGWWHTLDDNARRHVQEYFGIHGHDIAWDFIRIALMSVCDTAIIPIQDVLRLGSEARMNQPGNAIGNWSWRLQAHQLTHEVAARLGRLTSLYGRVPLEVPSAVAEDSVG